MALVERSVLRRLILSWNDDGTFLGGQADWVDQAIDTRTGKVRLQSDRVGQPISGALQPGSPVADVLSDTEMERARSLQLAVDELAEQVLDANDLWRVYEAVANEVVRLRVEAGQDSELRPNEKPTRPRLLRAAARER